MPVIARTSKRVVEIHVKIVHSTKPGEPPRLDLTDETGTALVSDPIGDQWVHPSGEMHFFFVKGDRPGDPVETADLYVIPQSVVEDQDIISRRDSPFHRPQDPVHFIEDPGWGAGAPANEGGGLSTSAVAKLFAGSIPIRGYPGSSPVFKYAVLARGDRGRWISVQDPTIKIEP